jgi:polysaccharide pyruvyl transferase WcaK-like protein
MVRPDRARVFCSREYNASQIVCILRSLEMLVTSRYHACVLSLAAQVPQIAVGHDLRLKTIYQELGLFEDFFVDCKNPNLYENVRSLISRLLKDPSCVQAILQSGYEQHKCDAQRNRALLKEFIKVQGWEKAHASSLPHMATA